jgi:hypothetical protein
VEFRSSIIAVVPVTGLSKLWPGVVEVARMWYASAMACGQGVASPGAPISIGMYVLYSACGMHPGRRGLRDRHHVLQPLQI